MSYRRLNLQDFKDVWTAANISHIEDGVINNELELGTIKSTVNDIEYQLKDLVNSETINSIAPLWNTLLSNGGEKIYPPTISFDGNVVGKTYLPLDGDESSSIGYVRIGDATSSFMGAMTCGGLYHILVQLSPMLGNLKFNVNIDKLTGIQLLVAASISGEESYDYGDKPVIIYNSKYQTILDQLSNSGSVFSAFPTAFSIDRSFEFDGIIYPSGFYSIYTSIKDFILLENLHLPFFYVDKFWALDTISSRHQANMPLDYSKASNAFECFEESIFWNGIDKLNTDIIVPLDHPFSSLKCISYNPQQFLQACLSATKITINGNTVSLEEISLSDEGDSHFCVLGNIVIVPTIVYEGELAVAPGVYVLEGIQPLEVQFYGVDTQKLFNKHEINPQYLPDVPEFNLADMGMSNVSLDGNFVTLEMNTTKLKFCSRKGPVRITIPTEVGEVSCLATFNAIGSNYQSVITGYYDAIKFDTVITFTNNSIMVGIFPVSQFA